MAIRLARGVDSSKEQLVVFFLLQVLGRECYFHLFSRLVLASLAEFKELGVFTSPGNVKAADVKQDGFEALH